MGTDRRLLALTSKVQRHRGPLRGTVLGLVGGLLALSVFAASSVTADHKKVTCYPPQTSTFAKSNEARIYGYPAEDPHLTGQAFGCHFHVGSRFRLTEPDDQEANGPFATLGRYTAFAGQACSECASTGCLERIIVLDLLTRRIKSDVRSDNYNGLCTPDTCVAFSVSKITVKRNGSAAWITCDGDPHFAPDCEKGSSLPFEVFRLDHRGRRLLDEGRDIDPRSLRLSRSRKGVVWTKSGKRYSASLQ